METFIDPSLARGIRRAYLESLDDTWAMFQKLQKRQHLRQPHLQVKTQKGFDKEVEKLRKSVDTSNLMQSEILVRLKTRALWACLFLSRETRDSDGDKKGMTSTGYARVRVCALTYPANEWVKPMSIRITAHAIDRVIQRTGIVDLPITKEDIRAINTELSQSLIWAAASFFILGKIEIDEAPDLTLILPSQHGFFLGKFETNPIELSLVTYVDRDRTWEEQDEAFKLLDTITDTDLGLFASDIIARHHINVEHSDKDDAIYRCWRDYGWRIREKIDRPGELDAAWNIRSG